MKTLRLIGMALLAVVLSVNFAACSDDDEGTSSSNNEASQYDDEILGLWECIETSDDSGEASALDVGRKIKFFSGEYSYEKFLSGKYSYKDEDGSYVLSGKKCILSRSWAENNFNVNGGIVTDPTEEQWDMEEDYLYNLNGSSLTIMEADLDRWVGTISIEGDVMTFTYTYQNWNATTVSLTSVYGPYTSKFQRQ